MKMISIKNSHSQLSQSFKDLQVLVDLKLTFLRIVFPSFGQYLDMVRGLSSEGGAIVSHNGTGLKVPGLTHLGLI